MSDSFRPGHWWIEYLVMSHRGVGALDLLDKDSSSAAEKQQEND